VPVAAAGLFLILPPCASSPGLGHPTVRIFPRLAAKALVNAN